MSEFFVFFVVLECNMMEMVTIANRMANARTSCRHCCRQKQVPSSGRFAADDTSQHFLSMSCSIPQVSKIDDSF